MASRLLITAIALTALACANRPGPICVSTVTVYLEGAKAVTKDKALYGAQAAERTRTRAKGAEARIGIATEFDASGRACRERDE